MFEMNPPRFVTYVDKLGWWPPKCCFIAKLFRSKSTTLSSNKLKVVVTLFDEYIMVVPNLDHIILQPLALHVLPESCHLFTALFRRTIFVH